MRQTCFLLLGLLAIAAPARLCAQAGADAPPIKMGLWQMTMNFDRAPQPRVIQSCLTPETYKQSLTRADEMGQRAGCSITRNDQSGREWTLDFSCFKPNMQITGHTVTHFLDTEHITATSTVTSTLQGKQMNSNTTIESHFVKSDCGDVKPRAVRTQ